MLANIRAQRVGAGTVSDLDLPLEFLARVRDRIIRASFHERHRIVVADHPAHTAAPSPPHAGSGAAPPKPPTPIDPWIAARWAHWSRYPEVIPGRLGFFPPLAAPGTEPAPDEPFDPPPGVPGELASLVLTRLPREGLERTARRALDLLARQGASQSPERALADAGVPLELLDMITTAEEPPTSGARRRDLAFRFRPSRMGFRALSDSGGASGAGIRLQATRTTHYLAQGDGGFTDLLTQLAEHLPRAELLILAGAADAPALASSTASRPAPSRLIALPAAPSQWAQDNAKPGAINGRPAWLLPRYTTRGEEPGRFIPTELAAAEALALAGHEVIHSPLIFQGGDLLVVDDTPRSRRVLLLGEATLHRNRLLGLSREQVLDAFRVEFGVDACVVLPAASYHIDYEVSVRSINAPRGPEVVAFVVDEAPAARLVLAAGIDAMQRAGWLDAGSSREATAALRAGHIAPALDATSRALAARLTPEGHLRESDAAVFSTGPADSGIGNAHLVRLAVDLLLEETRGPLLAGAAPHFAATLETYSRRRSDRRQVRAALQALGWRVVPVPALSEGDRSINPINGLHVLGRFLMPVYGGLFSPLDHAARDVFDRELPGVEVIPIRNAETQRREGGLRCSATPYEHTA